MRAVARPVGAARGAVWSGGGGAVTISSVSVERGSGARVDPREELDRILERGLVRSVYQPIVDLRTRLPVAYEALARGPEDSPLGRPDELFAAAAANDRLGELDWVCRTSAVRGALEARLRPPFTLFVNSEPTTLGIPMSPSFLQWWARAKLAYVRLMFEVTERAITSSPGEVLSSVEAIRSFGWGVALDDVGVDPASLALLSFIKPDVVKLDMSVVQGTIADAGEVFLAVNAEAERSGAMILAEGIENEDQLELARIAGATLGQGWLFGRPGPLPDQLPSPGPAIPVAAPAETGNAAPTPFETVRGRVPTRRINVPLMLGASRLLERRALTLPHPPLLIATFQTADRFAGATVDVYRELAARLPLMAVVAVGLAPEPAAGVRGMTIQPDDPLRDEWTICLLTPFSGILLSAQEQPGGPDRTFEVALTFDRALVIQAMATVVRRLVAQITDVLPPTGVEFASGLRRSLAESRDLREFARPILELMSESLGLESTFLSQISESDRYDVVVSHNHGALRVAEGFSMPWSETICHEALTRDRTMFEDVQQELPDVEVGSQFGFRTYVTCPVVTVDGNVIGTLCGASEEVVDLSTEDVDVARGLALLLGEQVSMREATS